MPRSRPVRLSLDQEVTRCNGLTKEIDRLAEENDNLKIILKGKQNGKE
jgi:hypothetical protein